MSPTGKERTINALISLGLVVTTVLFSNYVKKGDDKEVNVQSQIDKLDEKKLDKEDFATYDVNHQEKHKAEQEFNQKILEMIDEKFTEKFDEFKDWYSKNK